MFALVFRRMKRRRSRQRHRVANPSKLRQVKVSYLRRRRTKTKSRHQHIFTPEMNLDVTGSVRALSQHRAALEWRSEQGKKEARGQGLRGKFGGAWFLCVSEKDTRVNVIFWKQCLKRMTDVLISGPCVLHHFTRPIDQNICHSTFSFRFTNKKHIRRWIYDLDCHVKKNNVKILLVTQFFNNMKQWL